MNGPLTYHQLSFPVLKVHSDIEIDNKNIFISGFARKYIYIDFVGKLFHDNGKNQSRDYMKTN